MEGFLSRYQRKVNILMPFFAKGAFILLTHHEAKEYGQLLGGHAPLK